jgi:hypothetical protein
MGTSELDPGKKGSRGFVCAKTFPSVVATIAITAKIIKSLDLILISLQKTVLEDNSEPSISGDVPG